ncbi:MAG TPA: CopD family protein [Anaerolineales bacterium]|nr:CopD family protein [Anaerolineales bacterium]
MTPNTIEAPLWALSLAYWLHMLATIVWIGGLAALALLVLPAARQRLSADDLASLLHNIQSRLDPLAWMSLAVLTATGLFQMSANPNYLGFLAFSNLWARAILFKHLSFFLMVGLSAYLTWGLLPALRREALLRAKGLAHPQAAQLQRREIWLIRLNLLLGVIILGLTALARAS